MGEFQKIVIILAILILIIGLLIIAYMMKSKTPEWPPNVSSCPDWWIADGSGNRAKCVNVKDLGICPATGNAKHQIVNFNAPMFTGSNGDCNKYTWANKCKVSWDGVNYGVENPCT